MENMSQLPNSVYIAAIIGFLAGALIVWLMTRKSDGSSEELREEYDSLKKSHESYQKEVNAHFAKTADAIDTLTKSYQDVFSHLSQGAEKLMDKAALKAEVEKRHGKAVTLAYLTDKEGQEKPTPIPKESVIKESTPPTAKKESKPSANPEAKPSTKPTPKQLLKRASPLKILSKNPRHLLLLQILLRANQIQSPRLQIPLQQSPLLSCLKKATLRKPRPKQV